MVYDEGQSQAIVIGSSDFSGEDMAPHASISSSHSGKVDDLSVYVPDDELAIPSLAELVIDIDSLAEFASILAEIFVTCFQNSATVIRLEVVTSKREPFLKHIRKCAAEFSKEARIQEARENSQFFVFPSDVLDLSKT